ncbi:hypothetical protein PI124_g22916 [Phytophthora idaei]|nr:hypothetical protein PI125_g24940 [Phytophthora idaei]KAG3125012.1 hypothetical protein PI126_g22969 [Phytophthora idaei]KAG3231997.1 hypothetical protein PI124_g22916 [Phytophthora idaei]
MRSIYLLLLVVGELHNAALAADEAPQLERHTDVIRMDSVEGRQLRGYSSKDEERAGLAKKKTH